MLIERPFSIDRATTSIYLRVAFFAFVLWTPAHAEISVGESIGWIVADSDLIVRGTITDVQSSKQPQIFSDTVTVKVAEVLKGKRIKTIAFAVSHSGSGDTPAAWKSEAVEMLLFFREHAGMLTLRSGNFGWRNSVVRLNGKPKRGVFTVDLRQHTKSKDILVATRTAVAHLPKVKQSKRHQIDVPSGTDVYSTHHAGSAVFFVVPVNNALQIVAKKWISSATGDFSNALLRREGVRALQYFKSDENAKLLKTLLSDTTAITMADGMGPNPRRIYVIRRDAYNTLKSWKIEVERPILEQSVK